MERTSGWNIRIRLLNEYFRRLTERLAIVVYKICGFVKKDTINPGVGDLEGNGETLK